jgi:hypothetical protein
MAAIGVMVALASPLAQSTNDRAATAHQRALETLQEWLGPAPSALAPAVPGRTAFPSSPMTMDLEAATAFALARQWWPQQPSTLADGVSRYLQGRVVARSFDLSFGRAGAGVDKLALFGGTYTVPFSQLRFDGPAAGLDRLEISNPIDKVALAFASLERLVGQPRFIGALHALVAQRPDTDARFITGLNESLGQDVSGLFDAAASPVAMNYAIANVTTEPCMPAPCTRLRVDLAHQGPVFAGVEVRAEFADGQIVSTTWNGREAAHEVVFEGPSEPVRVSLDPDAHNLLDDNLADQSMHPDGRTNVAMPKWIGRWLVWLQNAMLAYSAIV